MRADRCLFTASDLVVVIQPEVCDLGFSHEIAECVLQLHQLNEQIVLRIECRRALGALKIEGEPFLDAGHGGPLGQIHEEHQVQDQRRGQDAVSTEEIDPDLHRVPQPAEDINAVPALFLISPRRGVPVLGCRMVSKAASLLFSLVLNESLSSSTNPSLFPRMFVEYHPLRPSMRALSPGARMVFIKVCPVLKSFPATASPCCSASSSMAGMSTVRFGAPFM